VALGAALKESPSSTGGATVQAGGRGQRLPGGLGAGGQGASGLGAGGLGGFSRIDQSATPTTLAPIEGRLTEVDPDYVSVRVGEEDSILAVTDDTLIIRTRTVTDKELAVGQQVRVEPTDADRIAAKSITILP
jgi:hypothetical protein